ncbi:hypothetical protein ACFWM1_00675 [Nocardia sp. NPDC058379]|uniref:hypothetical protein n=1 Tax=unclassified Nocardia TaxID=2637762 RepID=UPI00365E784F
MPWQLSHSGLVDPRLRSAGLMEPEHLHAAGLLVSRARRLRLTRSPVPRRERRELPPRTDTTLPGRPRGLDPPEHQRAQDREHHRPHQVDDENLHIALDEPDHHAERAEQSAECGDHEQESPEHITEHRRLTRPTCTGHPHPLAEPRRHVRALEHRRHTPLA